MDKKSKNFLYSYLNNASPTGFEHKGQQLWLDYIKPYTDDYLVDVYGTAVGIINPKASYKVVIEAHADEISWFVNYITEEGYIYVRRNGGSDHQIAPSMRVNIHTDKGIVKGIFGWPAIHVRDAGKEETPTLKNICIDVGAEWKKEVDAMGVHVGCVITFVDELMELNTAHPQLEKSLGYRGDARWVAWRWEPEIDQVICSDGKIVLAGNNLAWLVFLQHDLVQPVLQEYKLGERDRHSLLLDRQNRNLYIGEGNEIQTLLEQPESLMLLTCLDRNTKGDSLRDSFASRKFGATWQQKLAKTSQSDYFRHLINLIPVSIVATLIGALAVGTGIWVLPTAQQKLTQKTDPISPVNFESNCYLGNSYKFSSHVGSSTGNKELHLIAAYEATSPQDNGNPSKNTIEIKIQRTNKPIILALSAYEAINWNVAIAPGTVIEKIIISGYEKQTVSGLSGIPIEAYSYKGTGKNLTEGNFMYEWDSTTDSTNSPSIVTKLEQITQTKLTSFQGCYRGTSFMIKWRLKVFLVTDIDTFKPSPENPKTRPGGFFD